MSTRSSYDRDLQLAERNSAHARDLMSLLKETAPSSAITPNSSASDGSSPPGGTQKESKATKRSIIMKSKQKLRYRNSASSMEMEEDAKKAIAEVDQVTSTAAYASATVTASTNNSNTNTKRRKHAVVDKKLDKYGFIKNMDANGLCYEYIPGVHDDDDDERVPTFAETKRQEKMEKKWNQLLQSWEIAKRRRKRLSKTLRKGIPDAQRARVWLLLCNVVQTMESSDLRYEDYVRKSLESTGESNGTLGLPRMRSESLVNSKSFRITQETIERDIHRTYPRHSYFHEEIIEEGDEDEEESSLLRALSDDEVGNILKEMDAPPMEPKRKDLEGAIGGQAALRRVLRAYSVRDREVGYCQGMNFIAGMFLTFMTEEQSFWMLNAVMNDQPCRMRGLFGADMEETHQVLYIADRLTFQFLPKLARHMEQQSIHISMYATQWFLTLYTSSFGFDLVTRIWDCFLADGWKILYRVMLALLQQAQSTLLKLTFEDILAYFRDLPKNVSGGDIVDLAFKIPLRRKHVEKYKKEYLSRQANN